MLCLTAWLSLVWGVSSDFHGFLNLCGLQVGYGLQLGLQFLNDGFSQWSLNWDQSCWSTSHIGCALDFAKEIDYFVGHHWDPTETSMHWSLMLLTGQPYVLLQAGSRSFVQLLPTCPRQRNPCFQLYMPFSMVYKTMFTKCWQIFLTQHHINWEMADRGSQKTQWLLLLFRWVSVLYLG